MQLPGKKFQECSRKNGSRQERETVRSGSEDDNEAAGIKEESKKKQVRHQILIC